MFERFPDFHFNSCIIEENNNAAWFDRIIEVVCLEAGPFQSKNGYFIIP